MDESYSLMVSRSNDRSIIGEATIEVIGDKGFDCILITDECAKHKT